MGDLWRSCGSCSIFTSGLRLSVGLSLWSNSWFGFAHLNRDLIVQELCHKQTSMTVKTSTKYKLKELRDRSRACMRKFHASSIHTNSVIILSARSAFASSIQTNWWQPCHVTFGTISTRNASSIGLKSKGRAPCARQSSRWTVLESTIEDFLSSLIDTKKKCSCLDNKKVQMIRRFKVKKDKRVVLKKKSINCFNLRKSDQEPLIFYLDSSHQIFYS